jgi:hypothetical protein
VRRVLIAEAQRDQQFERLTDELCAGIPEKRFSIAINQRDSPIPVGYEYCARGPLYNELKPTILLVSFERHGRHDDP